MGPYPCRKCGFSMVEVTLALGIFAFCVVNIIYLLGIGIESSRSSYGDSAYVAILKNMESELRGLTFTNSNPSVVTLSNVDTQVYRFDDLGNLAPVGAAAFYEARVKRIPFASIASLTSLSDPAPVANEEGMRNLERHYLWMLTVSSPTSNYAPRKVFLIGRTLLGAGRLIPGSTDYRFYD